MQFVADIRNQMDAFDEAVRQYRVLITEDAIGKTADITLTPTTAGEAEQMQVRIQLRKNNQNYGQPSDAVYVTINP